MAKISVIVPVYGVEKYLKQCLDSILSQTYKDLEIILIDDGGKDKCPQIIDEYASNDNRIVAVHKPNGGYGAACNMGLSKATGEYISIIEPDDFIEKTMFEDMVKVAIDNDADIVKTPFKEYYDCGKYQSYKPLKWSSRFDIPKCAFNIRDCAVFLRLHPSIWSCLYKKSFLDKHNIKFVEAPGAGWADNPFQVQTLCLAEKIMFLDKHYYNWRKTHLREEKDLKDYTIPFKRSDDIHNWLDENKVTDKNILTALYRRELSYMMLTLGAIKLKDLKEVHKLCVKMIDRMDKNIVRNNIPRILQITYFNVYNLPHIMWMWCNFHVYKRENISLRWNSSEKSLMLFGKYWRF